MVAGPTHSLDVLQFLREVLHSVLDLSQEPRGSVRALLALLGRLPGLLQVSLELLQHSLTPEGREGGLLETQSGPEGVSPTYEDIFASPEYFMSSN